MKVAQWSWQDKCWISCVSVTFTSGKEHKLSWCDLHQFINMSHFHSFSLGTVWLHSLLSSVWCMLHPPLYNCFTLFLFLPYSWGKKVPIMFIIMIIIMIIATQQYRQQLRALVGCIQSCWNAHCSLSFTHWRAFNLSRDFDIYLTISKRTPGKGYTQTQQPNLVKKIVPPKGCSHWFAT